MRILHAPTNIAGQPYVLSRALRRLGHVSDVLVSRRHPFGYSQDIVFDFDRLWTPWRQVRKAFALLHLRKSYDLFHFYYGESLLARHRDLPMLKRAGKRIVFHFRGCDIRMRGLELARRATCACKDCPAPCSSDPEKESLRDLARRLADRTLVATPDLLEWVPEADLVTQAIELGALPELPPPAVKKDRYVILHAPSDPLIKGTCYLRTAIAHLRSRGYPVDLRLVSGRPHSEVRQAIAEADIVVDQLLVGWYGNFAIEAMASSRPVVAYIRDDLARRAGFSPPILSATPDSIERVLEELVANDRVRAGLARAGRPFVSRIHDAGRIASQLLDCYRSIVG